jgi:hypothetical protein
MDFGKDFTMENNLALLAASRALIDQVIARGQVPVAYLMNPRTAQAIAETLAAAHKARLSTFGRLWLRIRHGHAAPRLEALYGVPVGRADYLPDGGLFLQSVDRAQMGQPAAPVVPTSMGPPAGLEQAAQDARQQLAARGEEFWKKDRVDAMDGVAAGEIRPTLNDLSSGNGERPSASDVLMKSLEQADDLAGVVVIRVYRNGSIDLCANVEKYALQGVIQHAQMWAMRNGK